MLKRWLNFFLDLFFPKQCFGCSKEGAYLCPDCQATLEVSGFHQKFSTANLTDLYFPVSYRGRLIKDLIKKFKYEPFAKELAQPLSSLIIEHFQLLDNKPDLTNFLLVPAPLAKRRLKWRGFNQATAVAEELASSSGPSGPFLNLEIPADVLIRTKETKRQVDLSDEERKENIKGAFVCPNPEKIKDRKILLIDDVYTTGATMEECARTLKEAGAEEVVGLVVARD